MIRASISTTKLGTASVELLDGDVCILKAYPNSAGDKLRIILPEWVSFKQSRLDLDGRYIEFERSVK
jgi:hypothetical protein